MTNLPKLPPIDNKKESSKKKMILPDLKNKKTPLEDETDVKKETPINDDYDDVFSVLNEEEILDEDELDELEQKEEVTEHKSKISKEEIKDIAEGNNIKDIYDIEVEEPEEFIDKKKKKIIPFGGKKSKVKVDFNSKDYDSRKNRSTKLRILRFFLMLFIIILFALGIKNTYFPEQIYTKDEIEYIAQNSVGKTGFPVERGRAFVEEFFTYYLTADSKDTQDKILARFSNGNTDIQTEDARAKIALQLSKPGGQRVLAGPFVFQEYSPSLNSGFYKVTAKVTGETKERNDSKEAEKMNEHWVSFSINLYYDETIAALSIAGEPSMIPSYKIAPALTSPEEEVLGNGVEVTEDINRFNPVIDGYINAYIKSNVAENKEVLQYIVPNTDDTSLFSGFADTVKLESGDESITKKIWQTDNPNEWVADVNVALVDKDSNESIKYNSRMILTLQQNADGVILVKENTPYVYQPKESIEE